MRIIKKKYSSVKKKKMINGLLGTFFLLSAVLVTSLAVKDRQTITSFAKNDKSNSKKGGNPFGPADPGPSAPCKFQISINNSPDNPNSFSFVIPAMNMTTARVEGIVAIGENGGIVKKGPFYWHPGEPMIWGMTQSFDITPGAILAQMVVWHYDTLTVCQGLGVWENPQAQRNNTLEYYTDIRVPFRVLYDANNASEIRVLKLAKDPNVKFTASTSLLQNNIYRLVGINIFYSESDMQYFWGPFPWVPAANNESTYTMGINSNPTKAALMGIINWTNPSKDGVIKAYFGYGASYIK